MSSKFPQASPLLYKKCIDMTSTMPGIKALASKEGYTHLLLSKLIQSAYNGCPLCKFLRRNQQSDSYPDAHILVFPRYPILQKREAEEFRIQSESIGHPFEIAKLETLISALWDENVNFRINRLQTCFNTHPAWRLLSFCLFHECRYLF